jgi:methenyltetrahydromethanopterin cyclohydrolase
MVEQPLPTVNELAYQACEALDGELAAQLKIAVQRMPSGARLIDCGAAAPGGLEAGRRLAEICLGGLGQVSLQAAAEGVSVVVQTDHPLLACIGSQYAGWQVKGENYFAMGSGPMRIAAGKEAVLKEFGLHQPHRHVVGVLETAAPPPEVVLAQLAADCGVAPPMLTVLFARTASIAGAVQVVARSVETALHKLHELKYDLRQVVSGFGSAPLPPIAAKDRLAIGLTNDSVLYGGDVTLWVRGDDDELARLGPLVPSSASRDFGEPFGAIFERYGRDFYKIDPLLFSPARITFHNLSTGRTHRFGELRPDILARSFSA